MLEAPSSPIPKLELFASSVLTLVGDIGGDSTIATCYNETRSQQPFNNKQGTFIGATKLDMRTREVGQDLRCCAFSSPSILNQQPARHHSSPEPARAPAAPGI